MNWRLHEAVRLLCEGGVIAYPTETVYGLGCDPYNPAAVLYLLTLKQRDINQGLILIASSIAQLEPFLDSPSASILRRITRPSSTPRTWVVPCRKETPAWLTGAHNTLAIRITSHPVARALCDGLGSALVSTSANLHGQQPAVSALRVRKIFGNRLAAIVHGSCGSGKPSAILDAASGKVLRN